jgi:hypothetical protein
LKVPAINELMIDVPAPEMRTIADENAAMSIGQPSYAYIQQDHIAHIQGHLQFANDPAYGSNPFFAPQFTPHAIEHIKQHMTLWYLNRMNGYVAQSRGGKPVTNYEDVKLTGIIDQVFAAVGQHVSLDTSEVFQQIMPQLQQTDATRPTVPTATSIAARCAGCQDTQHGRDANARRKKTKPTLKMLLKSCKQSDKSIRWTSKQRLPSKMRS